MACKSRDAVRRAVFDELETRDVVTQSMIVDAVDVSKATVSRRLAELDDAGEIVRMMIAGQNHIWKSGESPLEGEI